MSTSNKEVFDRFLTLIEDEELCSLLTDEQMTYHLEYFLNESSSVYFKNCEKDLSDYEKADFYTQPSVGTIGQSEVTLTKYPNSPNETSMELICTVNEVSVEYTFDELTTTFTFVTPLVGGEAVVVGYNFIGQLNEDLDDEELWILAHGMIVTWNSGQVNAERKLKNSLSTTDYKYFSPANLLKELISLRKQSLREIRQLRVSYSFNDFKGFN